MVVADNAEDWGLVIVGDDHPFRSRRATDTTYTGLFHPLLQLLKSG